MKTISPIRPRLLAVFGILSLAVAQSAVAAVPQLAGSWNVTEKVTLRLRLDGESDVIKSDGTQNLVLRQTGNRVSYFQTVSDPMTGLKRKVKREGTISGNQLVFRGIAMLPVSGISFTRNSMVTIATISADRRTITGKTTVSVAASGMGSTGTITGFGTVVMHSNKPIADIAVDQPGGKRLVDGKSTVGFGLVKVGESSLVKTFVIRNTGKARLNNLVVRRIGANVPDFIISKPAKNGLAAGGYTTFTVKFHPRAGTSRRATIRITSNDPDESPFDIKLTGMGAAGP